MSLQILQLVLHQFKQKNESSQLILRDAVVPLSDHALAMVTELNHIFQQKNKMYGVFNQGSSIAQQLHTLGEQQKNFLLFSQSAATHLHDELTSARLISTGVFVFCHYRFLAVDYLLIAALTHCDSLLINESLEVNFTRYLDMAHLDIATRISLTEWQAAPELPRYISYLKGRVGRKMSNFWQHYLDLDVKEENDPKVQNKALVDAIKSYCDDPSLSQEVKKQSQKEIYQYGKAQKQAGEAIRVAEISAILPAKADQDFQQFVAENTPLVPAQVEVNPAVLRQLTKYSGSGGGVTLSFDTVLLGTKIEWNETQDTLLIRGLPPNLRDQLKTRNK